MSSRMHIELTRATSEQWYSYWLGQFDRIWQAAQVPAAPAPTTPAPAAPTTPAPAAPGPAAGEREGGSAAGSG
jgi:hypothetical protein